METGKNNYISPKISTDLMLYIYIILLEKYYCITVEIAVKFSLERLKEVVITKQFYRPDAT